MMGLARRAAGRPPEASVIASRRQLSWSVLVALLVVAAFVVPAVVLRDRLPTPMAVHWTFGGAPDGSGGLVLTVGTFVALWLVLYVLVVPALAVNDPARPRAVSRSAALVIQGFATPVLVGASWAILAANLDHADWHSVSLSWWAMPVVVVLGVLGAVAGWLVSHRGASTLVEPAEPQPAPVEADRGEPPASVSGVPPSSPRS